MKYLCILIIVNVLKFHMNSESTSTDTTQTSSSEHTSNTQTTEESHNSSLYPSEHDGGFNLTSTVFPSDFLYA